MRERLIERLHAEQCSCVIYNNDLLRIFHKRGVADLHQLLTSSPDSLRGALIADKVVGKGAAVLMVAGGISWVYAEVISQAALNLLQQHQIECQAGVVVENIINRAGDDICPVEKLCLKCDSIEQAVTLIDEFIINNRSK